MTATTDRNGKTFCKPFNDNRGCKKKDDCPNTHACDLLIDGKACGQRLNRKGHDAARHGKPSAR